MKAAMKCACVVLLLTVTACATTKEPRKAPACTGKYTAINNADKYPTDQGTKR